MADSGPAAMSTDVRPSSSRSTGPGRLLLVFAGLTGFAISQPLLSVLGENPSFFAFRNIDGSALVWFALGVALVPPLVLWLVSWGVSSASAGAGRVLHLALVGVLLALTVIQFVKSAGLDSAPVVGLLALAAAVGGTVAYERVPALAMWVRYTAILPLFAVVSFLFLSDTSDLLQPPERVEAATPTVDGDESADLPSVVLVILDELPTQSILDEDRSIDPVRFPSLAAFAEDATWYRDFTTLASVTQAALPALLTGRDPTDEAPIWTNYPDNLFSLLAPSHHLTVFEAPTELCGVETCGEGGPTEAIRAPNPRYGDLIGDSIDLWRERVSLRERDVVLYDDFEERVDALSDARFGGFDEEGIFGPLAQEVGTSPTRLVDFIETFTPTDTPTLYFLHILVPHVPWVFYEDGTSYSVPIGDPPPGDFYPIVDQSDPLAWPHAVQEQRHLLQAQYADRLVGIVVDQLKSIGIYHDSLVVFASDHGIQFGLEDTNGRSVSDWGLPGVAFTPLLVKAPGQTAGVVSDENIMAIDLVPTIADIVDVAIPWETDGHPAGTEGIRARGSQKYVYEITGLVDLQLKDRRVYESGDFSPDAGNRWIGPIDADSSPVAGLYELLDVDVIGEQIDDLVGSTAGTAEVFGLGDLRNPPTDSAPLGIVTGRVTDSPADGTVVIAIDGTVVAGSPVYERRGNAGTFSAVLPSGTLSAEGNSVRMAQLVDGEYRELDLVES